jgi:hypothetical protein
MQITRMKYSMVSEISLFGAIFPLLLTAVADLREHEILFVLGHHK